MQKKIKIVALCGESGAGKDTILKWIVSNYPEEYHAIVSNTTRPKREHEIDGVDYHFLTEEEFNKQEYLEWTEFRGWYYGTPTNKFSTKKYNIGVFNPEGINTLLTKCNPNEYEISIFYITANPKIRLLRQLNREDRPDCEEICRRFLTDKEDFKNLNYGLYTKNYAKILNEDFIVDAAAFKIVMTMRRKDKIL